MQQICTHMQQMTRTKWFKIRLALKFNLIPLKYWMDNNVCRGSESAFSLKFSRSKSRECPSSCSSSPASLDSGRGHSLRSPHPESLRLSPGSPGQVRDTVWRSVTRESPLDCICILKYVSPLRRLPDLILTPATCRISTLVKLNSEFEMGLEWARKWEAELIYWSQKFTSFTQEGRGPSPTSPGCKCRRCSLLHIDECDPKEVSSLFKFLRKRKVICPNWKSMGNIKRPKECTMRERWPVFGNIWGLHDTEDRLNAKMEWGDTNCVGQGSFMRIVCSSHRLAKSWWESMLMKSMEWMMSVIYKVLCLCVVSLQLGLFHERKETFFLRRKVWKFSAGLFFIELMLHN